MKITENPSQFFGQVEVPNGLLAKVLNRITKEKTKLTERRKFWFGVALGGLAVVASFWVWARFWAAISESGFIEYAGLAVSDFKILAVSWQDFALSLLESLPVVNFITSAGMLILVLLLVRFIAKYRSAITMRATN